MTQSARQVLQIVVIAAALLLGVLLSFQYMRQSKNTAAGAAGDMDQAQQFCAQIKAIENRLALPGDRELEAADLAQKSQEAASKVNLPAASLLQTNPQPARRIGETAYQEISTQVTLGNVTLKQIIEFMQAITAANAGLQVRSIELQAPAEQETGEQWTAQLVLGHVTPVSTATGAGE